MTKAKIIEALSQKSGLAKKDVSTVLQELASLAYAEAENSFTIPGVGKLVLVDRKARMGRNPQTGEAIHIPAKRALKFRIAKTCKDAVLG
jgi:DNA-binding protein HU-beta